MENAMEFQAVRNLLNLCDQELQPLFRNNFIGLEGRVLTEQSKTSKNNTGPLQFHSYNSTLKVKTEQSAERTPSTTQNKENLKRILEKLRDSPSPVRNETNKRRERETTHVKTLNSEPQSRVKQFKKTPDLVEKSLRKMMHRVKEKDLIKTLVKAKIVEKLKSGSRQTDRLNRQEGNKISTLREIQGAKRGQLALRTQKKQKKESVSYYNLLRDERAVNLGALLSGKNSRVNLKHLLF